MANDILEVTELIPPSDASTIAEESIPRVVIASQWQLMWWKFRKHRLAMVSLVIIIALYIVAIFAGFFAPAATDSYHRTYTQAPPQTIYWLDNGVFAPYVYAYKLVTDPRTLKRTFTVDEETKIPLGFFVRGESYDVGLQGIPVAAISSLHITADLHFFGPIHAD